LYGSAKKWGKGKVSEEGLEHRQICAGRESLESEEKTAMTKISQLLRGIGGSGNQWWRSTSVPLEKEGIARGKMIE